MPLFDSDPLAGLSAFQRKTAHIAGEAAAIAALKLLQTMYPQKDAADLAADIETVVRKAVAKRMAQG